VDEVEMEPLSGVADNLTSPRLAFCNTTLEKIIGISDKKKEQIIQYEGFEYLMISLEIILNYDPANIFFSIIIKFYLISIRYLATETDSLFPVIVIRRSTFSPFSIVP